MSAGWYESWCVQCDYVDGIVFFNWVPHNMVFPKCPKCGHYTLELRKSKIPFGTIPTREEEPA